MVKEREEKGELGQAGGGRKMGQEGSQRTSGRIKEGGKWRVQEEEKEGDRRGKKWLQEGRERRRGREIESTWWGGKG